MRLKEKLELFIDKAIGGELDLSLDRGYIKGVYAPEDLTFHLKKTKNLAFDYHIDITRGRCSQALFFCEDEEEGEMIASLYRLTKSRV